jgi:hypothetical protein
VDKGWLTRRRNEGRRAKMRDPQNSSISEREARLRAVARMHPPKLMIDLYQDRDGRPLTPGYGPRINPRIYDRTEVMLSQGSVALPNCMTLEPKAVHPRRNYNRITREVARMIEEGGAQPEEIYFMCSEFFVFVRNWEDFLVRFGGRTIPHRIGKDKKPEVCYEDRTVTFGDDSVIKKVKSAGVFDFYLRLYFSLRDGRLERAFT